LIVSIASEIALIADVSPSNATQGDSLTITVTGSNTNFDSSLTTVSFSGSGIYVQAIRILSPTQLEADIVIDSMAPPGYRDVFVSTGVEDATALSAFNVVVLPTGVTEDRPLPARYTLAQAFPNPFNPTTTIRYELPALSRVKLTVFNMLGQVVGLLEDGIQEAGYREVIWNALKMASGVYIYKLEAVSLSDPAKGVTQVMKMVLMK
ncbi:MAG TPA: T9SS type A sorting domain-containing protein, partial [Bacteroidota bacterium]|nr:T9SS type A sorting domain-containing protein [Bacteroidota bacterium]